MKTFSKLFLAITLIAGSANAILDVGNIPAAMPIDPQEKLAWGICKLDEKVVAEAYNAGANLREITFKQNGRPIVENSYKALIASLIMNLNDEELVGRCDGQITDAMAEKFFQTTHKTKTLWKFFASKGVSEDVECDIYYIHKGSAREFMPLLLQWENSARDMVRQRHLESLMILGL